MNKARWVCPNCEMYSSRKYNVKRHIQNVHNGNGQIVSFIDYEVGRRNGIYPPVLPPLYIKKSSATTVPKIRPMDIFQNELLKAAAWKAVNKNYYYYQHTPILSQQQQHILNQISNSSSGGGIQSQISPACYYHPSFSFSTFPSKLEDIFGFKVYVCDKCSAIKPIGICYAKEGDQAGEVRIGMRCCGYPELTNNTSKKVNEGDHQKIMEILKKLVGLWTNNNNYLVAIKLPDLVSTSNNSIKIKHYGGRFVTLHYSEEKCIEIMAPINEGHWAERVTIDRQITLNNEELVDFLRKVGNATFGFFKVKSLLYLMAIANNVF